MPVLREPLLLQDAAAPITSVTAVAIVVSTATFTATADVA
jgi:hypothetical protein